MSTTFPSSSDAQLQVSITLANDGATMAGPSSQVTITVCEQEPPPAASASTVDSWFAAGGARPLVRTCQGRPVVDKMRASPKPLAGGTRLTFVTQIAVADAKLWTPETPNLYTLEVDTGDERTAISFGARVVTTKGSQVYLNGTCV